MILCPHDYQRRAKDFAVANKRCALHMDVGCGKTSTTLLAISELLDTFDVRGVMVFAPLRVATIAWPEELRKWDNFKHLSHIVVRGNEAQRVRQLNTPAAIYLLNFELAPWWVSYVLSQAKAKRPLLQDMLVFDESSRLKSSSSSRFKSLKPLCDSTLFPRIVELTGTPAPEGYEDLWAQYRLLDGGAALEPYVTHFRNKYFFQKPWDRFTWYLQDGAVEKIQAKIAPATVTILASEYLKMPQLLENNIYVDLPASARTQYDAFERDMVARIADETVAAPSAAIVSEKCRQVASGAVYNENKEPLRLHEAKFDALDDLIEDGGVNLLVCFWYKHELETIRRRYKSAAVIGPGVSTSDALSIVRRWNTGSLRLLFVHPSSVGHGINLQHGGNHLVWLTIPWSNELYAQMVGRLHRQGQSKPVTVHRILVRGTIEELVDSAIKSKEFSQRSLREALANLNKAG